MCVYSSTSQLSRKPLSGALDVNTSQLIAICCRISCAVVQMLLRIFCLFLHHAMLLARNDKMFNPCWLIWKSHLSSIIIAPQILNLHYLIQLHRRRLYFSQKYMRHYALNSELKIPNNSLFCGFVKMCEAFISKSITCELVHNHYIVCYSFGKR